MKTKIEKHLQLNFCSVKETDSIQFWQRDVYIFVEAQRVHPLPKPPHIQYIHIKHHKEDSKHFQR